MDTKLILVTGMSGSGKSTTSKALAHQLRLNGIRCRWLHEEIKRHPIRAGEFGYGSLYDADDLERNIQDMYRRWQRLVGRILRAKSVYILEGTLYDNILRYFFVANYPAENIAAYYDRLMQIMAPACPTVVLLYRADVRATLEGLYPLRGEWWKDLILDPSGYRYCQERGLTGQEGAYRMWQAYQDLSDAMFERCQGSKIKIETSSGQYDSNLQRLVEFLGLSFHPSKETAVADPKQYCGQYAVQVGAQRYTIEIDWDGTNLYCRAFWLYMKLLPMGGSRFHFASFSVNLAFHKDEAGQVRSVKVSGEYDWEIVGETMLRIST